VLLGNKCEFSAFPELFPNNPSANSREFGGFFKVVQLVVPFSRELRGFWGRVFAGGVFEFLPSLLFAGRVKQAQTHQILRLKMVGRR
jgi:hypothetical protein